MDERNVQSAAAAPADAVRTECTHALGAASGRVLVTELGDARRAAVATVLAEEGYEVCGCKDAEAVMHRAKQVTPDVVVLDMELPNGEPEKCVRALGRCYQTSSVAFVLACPRSFDRKRLMEMVQEGATIILPKPYTRQQLLDTVRSAVERSKTVKADLAIQLGAQAAVCEKVDSNNSLFRRPIYCVQHAGRPELMRYLLRPGAAEVENDFFGIPTYEATTGHDPVDVNLLGVMVCPECLFASGHASYFLDPAERKERRHHCDGATVKALQNDLAGRKELFAGRSDDFFTEKRTVDDAKIAYELAERCSLILHQQNPFVLPIELLRLGNYRLMLARLWEPTDAPKAKEFRIAAIEPLKRAITAIDGAGRAKAAHQLIALGIHLGDLDMSRHYMTVLADLEAAAPAAVKEQVQPYVQRARELIEQSSK
jgi:DNA-binding response OmpR family regulator